MAVCRFILTAASPARRGSDPAVAGFIGKIASKTTAGPVPDAADETSAGFGHAITRLLHRPSSPAPDAVTIHLFDLCAGLLSHLDESAASATLAALSAWDGPLTKQFRREAIFQFDDVCRLSAMEMQTLLRHIDQAVLVTALGGASPQATAKFMTSMCERAGEYIRRDLAEAGTIAPSRVHEAQGKILAEIRRLRSIGAAKDDGAG